MSSLEVAEYSNEELREILEKNGRNNDHNPLEFQVFFVSQGKLQGVYFPKVGYQSEWFLMFQKMMEKMGVSLK